MEGVREKLMTELIRTEKSSEIKKQILSNKIQSITVYKIQKFSSEMIKLTKP